MPKKSKAVAQTENLLKVRGKFQPDMARWVLDPVSEQEISQEVDYRIQCILRDRRRRSEVFLTALVRNQIERIMFLVSRLPEVENELFRPERIHAAKTSDLIRLVAEMADGIDKSSAFLRSFVSDSDLKSEPVPSRVGFVPGGQVGSVPVEPKPEEQPGGEKEPEPENADQLARESKRAGDISVESRQRLGSILRKLLASVDYRPPVVDVKVESVETDEPEEKPSAQETTPPVPVKKPKAKKKKKKKRKKA